MTGHALSHYCGLLNEYYELLATGQYEKADALADEMDRHWENLSEEEREQASQHGAQLAERYTS